MGITGYLLSLSGLLLMAAILVRLKRNKLYRDYPFVTAYLLYAFLRTLAILYFQTSQNPSYPSFYWYSNVGAQLLWFGVAWNIHSNLLSAKSVVRTIGAVVVSLALGMTAVAFYVGNDPRTSWVVESERKIGFAVALWLMALVAIASFYGLRMGRNAWGLAVGAGIYLAIAVMNFAALDLVNWFYPFMRAIRPFSFLFMLTVWLWAVWSVAPVRVVSLLEASPVVQIRRWREAWANVGVTLRKVLRP